MENKYLVINAGSSSLKFTLYEMPNEIELAKGTIERIGEQESTWKISGNNQKITGKKELKTHREAVQVMMETLLSKGFINSIDEIASIGHRILHGGTNYPESVIIDETVMEVIKKNTKYGPLHHPGEIAAIEAMKEYFGDIKQVAVFDTSFHLTMKEENYTYPIPLEFRDKEGIRKYGFHGTSYRYITEEMKKEYGENVNLIVCHIGNGASVAAIKNGKCIDTSMGLTPLPGLMMGTRSGSVDPMIVQVIAETKNMTVEEAVDYLNNECGLKGITGKSDSRDVQAMRKQGDKNAILACKMYSKKIVDYIASYYFQLEGKVDAIIFTAGVGENESNVRETVINAISASTGIKLDEDLNNRTGSHNEITSGRITTTDSKIPVIVMPTNEEVMILKDTYNLTHKNVKTLTHKRG